MQRLQLPLPDEAGLTRSRKLQQLIYTKIEKRLWISFAEYQHLALYTPDLGYYSSSTKKFGKEGDFTTSPEVSVLFGKTLARQVKEIIYPLNGNILEIGAGSGKLALDLLSELKQLNALPNAYYILEIGADLRQRQQNLLRDELPDLFNRVHWIEELPQNFSGLIFANELLDTIPTHVIAWRNGEIFERGVACAQEEHFIWEERPINNAQLMKLAQKINPPNNYVSEINLQMRGFINSLATILEKGVIIMIDYGCERQQYYHPQRNQGTLMCHYQHHAHNDPFYFPGLQDITTHVDFSAVASAAMESDLDVIGYTSQGQFLINNGITEILTQISSEDLSAHLSLANQARWLLAPEEMGEFFRVIALSKNFVGQLSGFVEGNEVCLLGC